MSKNIYLKLINIYFLTKIRLALIERIESKFDNTSSTYFSNDVAILYNYIFVLRIIGKNGQIDHRIPV